MWVMFARATFLGAMGRLGRHYFQNLRIILAPARIFGFCLCVGGHCGGRRYDAPIPTIAEVRLSSILDFASPRSLMHVPLYI